MLAQSLHSALYRDWNQGPEFNPYVRLQLCRLIKAKYSSLCKLAKTQPMYKEELIPATKTKQKLSCAAQEVTTFIN